MAKVPVGVGPKLPQIVVLFGATGDLAHKKLLPGLFHLCTTGFIPKCRIIGVSLDALDAEGFRAIAREAVFDRHDRKPHKEAWPAFAETLDYVPMSAGRRRPQGRGREGRASLRRRNRACPLYERAAERRSVGGQDAF